MRLSESESCNQLLMAAKRFDWDSRWLTGQQYLYLLEHMDDYVQEYNLQSLPQKCHPPSIYTEPVNGMLYYLEGSSLRRQFGFPKTNVRKIYHWKKMNFLTNLPKKGALVCYLVASAHRCRKLTLDSLEPDYKMHAVVSVRQGSSILCHIRRLDSHNIDSPPRSLKEIVQLWQVLGLLPKIPIKSSQAQSDENILSR